MNKIRFIILILLTTFIGLAANAADKGSAIMSQCAAKFSNAPSLSIDFAIAHSSGSSDGTLVMCKNLFKINTPVMAIWFDGVTQWTYMSDSNEVNVTEPTGEELMESNPFEVICSFNSHFNCHQLKSSPSNDIVELTPKTGGMTIKSARITISKSTGWPTSLIMTFDGGGTTSIAIRNVSVGKQLPASQFKYDKKFHPTAEIIDLR